MKILSVISRNYYGRASAVEPMFLYFTEPLRALGHEVETFDHIQAELALGRESATQALVERIEKSAFDVVFYQTSGREPVDTAALEPLKKRVAIIAWNSDDDWQWPTTSALAGHFTNMITTYPHIYELNRQKLPNLILSQWACLGPDVAPGLGQPVAKDIDFSFAGAIYKIRNAECRYLRRKARLKCFGRGARLVNLGIPYFKGAFQVPWISGEAIAFSEINRVWSRSRISYTPLSGGPTGAVLSLKSRIFDMGCSGALMLSEHAPNLERYYEPDRECVTFAGLDDCLEKAKFYLEHEAERVRIASRYRERTLKEHLWTQRFKAIFAHVGLS